MKSYSGGCHCGKVRFEATLDLDKPVISCNCSICSKKGHLLAFASADDFKLLKGEQELQEYLFYRKVIHHQFCKTCGIGLFGSALSPDGKPTVAINVRCLDGVDLAKLKQHEYDGKSK